MMMIMKIKYRDETTWIFFKNESEEWRMNCFVQVSLCYTVVFHVFSLAKLYVYYKTINK